MRLYCTSFTPLMQERLHGMHGAALWTRQILHTRLMATCALSETAN